MTPTAATAGSAAMGANPLQPNTAKKNDPQNIDFLQFLVMQLKNQSPLNPSNSDQMMQQMAMMQMVSETRSLRTDLKEWAQAQGMAGTTSLLGRTVTVQDANSGVSTGRVDGVSLRDGKVLIRMGTNEYPFQQIIDVKEGEQ